MPDASTPTSFGRLLRNQFNYSCVRLDAGPRLHFINRSALWAHAQWADVALAADFGGCDLIVPGPDGSDRPLPAGTAHLLEHVLMIHYRSELLPLRRETVHFGAEVTGDQMLWSATGVGSQSQRPAPSVARVTRTVLAMLGTQLSAEQLATVATTARKDVENELAYRQGEDLKSRLQAALYRDHPIGGHVAGTTASLDLVTPPVLAAALACAGRRLRSVIVLDNWDRSTSEQIQQAVAASVEQATTRTLARPPLPSVSRPADRFTHVDSSRSEVGVGIGLPSLLEGVTDRAALARLVLVSYIAVHYPASGPKTGEIIGRFARLFFARRFLPEPWIFISDSEVDRQVAGYRTHLKRPLEDYREYFRPRSQSAILQIAEAGEIMRLCELADRHDLTLTDIVDVSDDISPADVDRLIDELSAPTVREALVYRGPELVRL